MKKNKILSSIDTDIEESFRDLRKIKNIIIAYVVAGILLCSFLVGLMGQYITTIFNRSKSIILLKCFKIGFTSGFIFTIALYLLYLYMGFRIYKSTHHDYTLDPDGDHKVSKQGIYGRAHWQREDEREKNFIRSKDPYEIKNIIVGKDENGLLYSVSDQIKSLNKNMAVFGPSGSGKSDALVKPMIYQNIIRGHSMIVTDSKGDLYKDTCHLAIKYHYKMRVVNLKSSELKNSDGCDYLKILKGAEDSDAKAEVLANIIIENSGDGHMDYFAVNEMNLLKAVLLLVVHDEYVRMGKDNLGEVYNICAHNTPDTLATMFYMLEDDDPAREAFSIYDQCEPKVKGQILNGMGIRLNKLSNKWLRQVVSNDEIDLLMPMKEKCIYYIIISDMDRAYKFIATLFFSEAFICLSEHADGMTGEERKKRIPVHFILDEYANTGAIPDMDQKVSTIRSRDITTTIILQDVGQLEHMYPDLWETILNNMSIKILLATNDDKTAEWFSKKLGTKTVVLENKQAEKNSTDIITVRDHYRGMQGYGKRLLMSPDELMNELSEDDVIVLISKRHPIKLKKYFSFEHPMDKEAKEKEMLAKKHLPRWRKRIQDAEKEKEERIRKEQEDQKKKMLAEKAKAEKLAAEKKEEEDAWKEYDRETRKKREISENRSKDNPVKTSQNKNTNAGMKKQAEMKTECQKKKPAQAEKHERQKPKEKEIPSFIVLDDELEEVDTEIPEIDIPDIEGSEVNIQNSGQSDTEEDNDGFITKWAQEAEEETEPSANQKSMFSFNQLEDVTDETADNQHSANEKQNASDKAMADLFS